jgi:hypothetical protein
MANIFTNFLDSVSGDLKDTNLKDYKHASRLFVQNFYRLAPKHGFLYFVRFRLNPQVVGGAWQTSRQDLELGMLVKKCDLPKITLDGTTVNIYNKKQPVYTKVIYNPINMSLHDDNAGLARSFWQMYYQYHTADSYYGGSNTTPGKVPLNTGNRYNKPQAVKNAQILDRSNPNNISYQDTTEPGRYGLDTAVTEPMIRSIEIYQLSRKQFFLHTLINPKIRSWNMDSVASDAKNLMEHNVTIEYEGVYFGKGKISRYNPDGWTDLHYDLDPSPIGGLFGRGDGGLYGPYGLINDGTDLFQDLQGTAAGETIDQRSALATLLKSAKLISNATNLNTDLAKAQVYQSMVTNIGFTVEQATSGSVTGLSVPNPATDTSVTEAIMRGSFTTTGTGGSGVTRVTTTTTDNANSTPDGGTTTSVTINSAPAQRL